MMEVIKDHNETTVVKSSIRSELKLQRIKLSA